MMQYNPLYQSSFIAILNFALFGLSYVNRSKVMLKANNLNASLFL
jgi:hypothetical protein